MRNPNSAQRIAVVSGAVLLVVAFLFPPVRGNEFLFLMSSSKGSIYFPLLLTELGLIMVLTLAAFFLLKGDGTTAARKRGVVSRASGSIKASASAIVQRLRGANRTNTSVAVTWAVVALLIAAECVFPVTAVHTSEVHPYEYAKGETSGFDIFPYVVIYKSNHRPVWLSDPSDILLGRIGFEMVALLLAGWAVSLLLSNRKNARKVRTVWSVGLMLLAGLCLLPPMRVYDSEATSRIVESRRTQKMQAWEMLIREDSAKTKSLFDEIPFDDFLVEQPKPVTTKKKSMFNKYPFPDAEQQPDTNDTETPQWVSLLDKYGLRDEEQPDTNVSRRRSSLLDKYSSDESTTPARVPTVLHRKVSKGETIPVIAKQYGVSTQALVDANNLSNNYRLTVGQTLLIPVPVEVQEYLQDKINEEDIKQLMVEKYVRRLINARPHSVDSAEFASGIRNDVGKRASEIGDSLLKAEEDSVAQSTGQDARRPRVYDRESAAKILGPSELVYKSAHTPVWTCGQDEMRYHQLALEMLAILLVSLGGALALRKKVNR